MTVAASTRAPKGEGSIADIFTSLTGEEHNTLPERFSGLKQELWKDSLVESWRGVLEALPKAIQEIEAKGSEVWVTLLRTYVNFSPCSKIIPRISYIDLEHGLSKDQVDTIKQIGVVIVKGGVPPEKALGWKQAIREYATANANRITGMYTPLSPLILHLTLPLRSQVSHLTTSRFSKYTILLPKLRPVPILPSLIHINSFFRSGIPRTHRPKLACRRPYHISTDYAFGNLATPNLHWDHISMEVRWSVGKT